MFYQADTGTVIRDLVDELREYHPELKKSEAKLVILNALLGNVAREELFNQANFLIENGGYSDAE